LQSSVYWNVLQSQDARLRTEPVALRFNFEVELKKFLKSGYIAEEAEFMIKGAQGDLFFQSIGKYYALTKSGTKIDRRAMRDANIPRSMTEPFFFLSYKMTQCSQSPRAFARSSEKRVRCRVYWYAQGAHTPYVASVPRRHRAKVYATSLGIEGRWQAKQC
jgi:hypothetical protein